MGEEFEVAIWTQNEYTKQWGYETAWTGNNVSEALAQLVSHKAGQEDGCVALFWR